MIQIIKNPISKQELEKFLGNPFSDMVKFVVDIQQGVIALGGELHADAEAILLEHGSKQSNLWGANIYPSKPKETRIEYTSLINIRPAASNNSMEVKNETVRNSIKTIVDRLIP